MLKTYELTARHFGWDKPPKPAHRREIAYLLDRALRAQGVVSLDSICHLDAPSKARVTPDRTAGPPRRTDPCRAGGRRQARALGGAGTLKPRRGGVRRVHILSPFDPLIIQRKRTELFFDYDHRFEAYVPKEKRLFGYFALPVLVGDNIVAALDLKTDRRQRSS